MKKTLIFVICLVLLCQGLPISCAAEGDLTVTSGCHSLDASYSMLGNSLHIDNCTSAVLYEASTKTLVYTQNPDERYAPSSIVKILTAVIALEKAELSEQITATQAVLNTIPSDAMAVDLKDGEVLSLQDLLYCMLTGSANDAAAVIANHISGSQEAFVAEMNAYAASIGCTNTNFMNVHGLHHDAQYMSARDAARILAVAIENEAFNTVFSAVHYTVPETNHSSSRQLLTGNYMVHREKSDLYFDRRVVGGRTGVTEDSLRNIAAHSKFDGLSYVSVVFGAESEIGADGYTTSRFGGYYETTDLLDAVDGVYTRAQILFEGQSLLRYTVSGGENALTVGPDLSFTTLLPKNALEDALEYRYTDSHRVVSAPVEKGEQISYVQIWTGDLCVAEAPLYALNSVKEAGAILTVSSHPTQKETSILRFVLLGIGAAALVCVAVVFLIKWLRSRPKKRKTRKYRRS